jgi:tetratricopeptide (TPR) repeat protein
MPTWTAYPYAGEYRFDTASVAEHWTRLHRGDTEPLPRDTWLLQAWAQFHSGEFQAACEAGLQLGGAGITLANKAQAIYANYLEPGEKARLDLFMEVAERARAQAEREPENPNAWYWHAYALGRYSQGISVAKALAQGLGSKVKQALEQTIRLAPRHADAHVALATFHAEVIDKVGSLIGGMTYGARRETGLKLFREALELHPDSAIAMMEHANGLVMLQGDESLDEATALYQRAAAARPLDAAERLDIELARAELRD